MTSSLSSMYQFLKMKLQTISRSLLSLDVFLANFTVLRFWSIPLSSLPADCDKATRTDLSPPCGTSPFTVLGLQLPPISVPPHSHCTSFCSPWVTEQFYHWFFSFWMEGWRKSHFSGCVPHPAINLRCWVGFNKYTVCRSSKLPGTIWEMLRDSFSLPPSLLFLPTFP